MASPPLKTPAAKRGRKPQYHHTSWDNEPIVGLARRPSDGRWRIIGTDITYTEPDERRAVARYRAWEAEQAGRAGKIDVFPHEQHAAGVASLRTRAADGAPVRVTIDENLTTVITDSSLRADQWVWLATQLAERPKWVAQMAGVEQLGYIWDLKKPAPSPTMDEVGDLYFDHVTLSDNWRAKSLQFWDQFCKTVGKTITLRELTQEHIVRYGDVVTTAASTATYVRQRFGAIKAVLNFPPKRGKWAEESQRAVALCKVLVKPKQSGTDPKPIEPEAFSSILEQADDQLRAMMLLSLNCCMYGGEVAALDWSEVNLEAGTLVTKRNKTGVVRVAVLWPRTIAALGKLERRTSAMFITPATKQRHTYQTVYLLFDAARAKCEGLTDVQFSHIRDGAYTAAVEAGVDLNICKLLAGHKTGISDHYVKRRPAMVAAACEAIERAYFG